MRWSVVSTGPLACAIVAGSAAAQVATFGPTPYLSVEDSPFQFLPGFLLEDFEGDEPADGISIATPGAAIISSDGAFGIGVDSVDGDDGAIDGVGHGSSVFTGGGVLRFEFDAEGLGALPTAAGLVWTDGLGPVTFSAFDAEGALLASFSSDGFADGQFFSATGEDRFLGVSGLTEISAIEITGNTIEVDHLQLAFSPLVPAPGATALIGAAGLVVARRRR